MEGESTIKKATICKPYVHNMIEGQRNLEAWEIDKGGEGTPWQKKNELKKGKVGDKKSWE